MEKYFLEAFNGLKQLAPGSNGSTLRAASYFNGTNNEIRILNIGCGTGRDTLLLSEIFPNSHIVSIDNNENFVKTVSKKIELHGFTNRINVKCMSMFDMDFDENSFDIIWAEGSIYIYGFKNALHDWKRFLKPNGYIICSDLSWITDEPSGESMEFWQREYPNIKTVSENMNIANEEGYDVIGHFSLPSTDWDNYYLPLKNNLQAMRNKYKSNDDALNTINNIQLEIDLYNNHSKEYNYVFYAMKNRNQS